MEKTRSGFLKFLKSGLQLIIGGLVGARLGIYLLKNIKNFDNTLIYLLIVFAGLILGLYVNTIIHEGGHLLFGYLTGYRFVSFRIGKVTLIKDDEGFKLKRFGIPGTLGQCLLNPPDMDGEGNYPYILYNLGGGVLNLLAATIVLFLSRYFPWNIACLLLSDIFIFIGYLLGIINLLPLKMDGIANDGYNIYMLLKDSSSKKYFHRSLRIHAQQARGLRLGEMGFENFELEVGDDILNPLIGSVKVNEFSYYIDKKDFERARKLGYQLVETGGLLELHSRLIKSELIYLELIEDRMDKAKTLYSTEMAKFLKTMKGMSPSAWRVEYGYQLLVEEDIKKAERELEGFYKALEKSPYKGEIELEKELVKILETRIEKTRCV